jgi:DNA-directed RNA polymerase subunit RPC12/RpoP
MNLMQTIKCWAKSQWDAKIYTLPLAATTAVCIFVVWNIFGMWLLTILSIIILGLWLWVSKKVVNIWTEDELVRKYPEEYACPDCGAYLRVEIRSDLAEETSIGEDRTIQQFSSPLYVVCRKCGYKRIIKS